MNIKSILFLTACILHSVSFSQSIEGVWLTIDDETHEKKSEIKIWREGDSYKGKVIKLHNPVVPDPVCDKCDADDPRYKQKVTGMVILTDLEYDDGNEWEDGKILDPENGSVYGCDMKILANGDLEVRGYIGFSLLGRTQIWKRLQ